MKVSIKLLLTTLSLTLVTLFTKAGTSVGGNTLNNLGYSSSDPKSVVAYSLRQLSTAYTGPLVRVTINDNTYDVWPDATGSFSMNSVISTSNPTSIPGSQNGTTTLSTVATGNTATIAIWYDQSGSTNNYNALQSTVSQQPQIINGGVINTQNGKPSAYFNGNSQYLQSATYAFYNFGSGASILSVWSRTGTTAVAGLFSFYENASQNYLDLTTLTPTTMRYESGINGNNIQTSVQTIAENNLYQQSCVGITQSINGGATTSGGNTGTMSGGFTSQFTLGYYTGFWTGYLSELIVFNTNLSTTATATGASNQNTYYTTPQETYTPPGNALAFDGATTYVSAGIPDYINSNGSSYTAEAWINPATLSTSQPQTIFGYGYDDGITGNGIKLVISTTGTLQVLYSQVTGFLETGYTFPSANRWYHVAMTLYQGVVKIYVNGVQTPNTTSSGANTSNQFYLGAENGIRYFNGQMDEFRFYNYPLDASHIQQDMVSTNANSCGLSANLIAYYHFDRGVAGANNAGIGGAYDTQNNYPGTLNNFSLTGTTSNWVTSYAMVIPTATAATNVTANGFTANWTAPINGTVTSYLLDVSTNPYFTSFVSGYQALNVNGFSQAITGLPSATYYYRVTPVLSGTTAQGAISNTISQYVPYAAPGNALAFDGATNFVTANVPLTYVNNFTIETWINPSSFAGGNKGIFSYGYDNTLVADGVNMTIDANGVLYYNHSAVASYNTGYTLTTNKWYHIAITRSGGVSNTYVNGVLVFSTSATNPKTPSYFTIGSHTSNRFFAGKIDEFRFYNTALTQAQILSDAYDTTISSPANLVLYYNFDEGVAGANNAGITTLVDKSSNSINGTLNSFTLSGTTSNWVESYAMVVPTATAATNVGASGFTGNWTAPVIGTLNNYILDVSTASDFSGPVTGSPFTIAVGTTSQAVTGLTAAGTYYYRVRADKTSVTGQGGYSNTDSATLAYTAPGNALNFNGTNNYVQIPHNNALNSSSYTLECWINVNSFNFLGGFISKYQNGGSFGYRLSLNSAAPYTGLNFDGLETPNGIFEAGKWYHVVAINNNGTRTVYVNGTQYSFTSGSTYTVNTSNTDPLTIGVDYLTSPRYFNGKIDQVRIYNTVLTSTQFNADMFSTTSSLPANLVAYYNFDNGIANATNTGTTTLKDLTSNGNNGILNNFSLSGATSNWVESYAMVIPTATAASGVTSTGFTANWTAPTVGIVNNYLVDVSTASDFTAPVTGSPFTVASGTTSQAVTGLAPGSYYYRVRADKTSVTEQGGYSNTILQYVPYAAPGNALAFDGATNFVTANVPLTYVNNFTIETWINPSSFAGGNKGIFSYGYDNTLVADGVNMTIDANGVLYYNHSAVASYNTGYTLTTNKWYHIAITRSGGVSNTYVNGVLVFSTSATNPKTPSYFTIGSHTSNRFFAGKIDEFRFYNTALTQAQILSDAYDTTISSPANLVLYYNFDEGVAGANNAGITTLVDKSSNSINGTLNSFTLSGTTSNWVESYAMVVPTATAATNVGASGFTANWTASIIGIANNYLVDVSTASDFTAPVTGSPFTVASPATSISVTGLSKNTTYYYRVRADKSSVTGQGGYSNIDTTTTFGSSITNFYPISGCIGTSVTINGLNFVDVSDVSFNGVSANSVLVLGSTKIIATVPPGATNGEITVTTSSGKLVTNTKFIIGAITSYAYMPDTQNNNINVVNTATNKLVTTVGVGNSPWGIDVSPDGTKVYVANVSGKSPTGTVSVINTATNQVISTIGVGQYPSHISVSPDGTKAYVTNEDGTISVINTSTNTVTATIAGVNSSALCVSYDGSKVFAIGSGINNNYVHVINTLTNTITASFTIGVNGSSSLIDIKSSPYGAAYIVDISQGVVYAMNTYNYSITSTIAVGYSPYFICISPDGTSAYVTNSDNKVSVINTLTNKVTTDITVGNNAYNLSITGDGSEVYVINGGDNTISVINTATNTVISTFSDGGNVGSVGNFMANGYASVCPIPTTNTWTGAFSTAWNNIDNWSSGVVPDSTQNVVIPVVTNEPVITLTDTVKSITIESGASLTNNGTINVYGSFLDMGSFHCSNSSSVVLKGTGTISGTDTFANLEIQGNYAVGASLVDKIYITGMLTKTSGTLTTSDKLTLISTATGSALIEENGGALSGKAYIQHYAGGNFGYHHFSSPISDGTVNSWSNAFPITGPDGAPSWLSNWGSLQIYDEVDNTFSILDSGYYNYTATSKALTPGKGYTAWLNSLPTLNTFGTPNNGAISIPVTHSTGTNAPKGWNFVGNPYPSPISWKALKTLNPGLFGDASCYLWKASGVATNGTWTAYDGTMGVNGAGDVINSSLGFFVYVDNSGTLKFDNTVRTYNYTNPEIFGSNSTAASTLRISIKDEAARTTDEAVAYTSNQAGFSRKMAQPATATNATIAFDVNGTKAAINTLTAIDSKTELPVTILTPKAGAYTISLNTKNINLPVYLKDAVTGTYTDLSSSTTITTTSKETSGRYSLVFAPLTTYDSRLTTITAYPNPAKSNVEISGTHIASVQVVDNLGRVVKTVSLKDATNPTLSLGNLPAGAYHLRVQTTDGKINNIGMVKE